MSKEDLLQLLAHVFDHYLCGDLDDEQREDAEKGYQEIERIIQEN